MFARRIRALGTFVLFGFVILGMTPPERELAPPIEIVAPGAHPSAVAAVRRLLMEMRVDERLEARLRRARLSIVVVPRRTAMTDVPEFASLRGQRTFDGRLWDKVRGTGGVSLQDGRVAVAIPEESILGGRGLGDDDAYPALAVAVHELAHALHDRVLTDGDRRAVERAFRARIDADGPFTDAYARSNPREYFAQGANAFFGRYASREHRDANWLYLHDRALYAALAHVFGRPPALPLQTNV